MSCTSIQILADRVGIPCKLVKGSNYTRGDDDDAINIIKMDNERYQYVLSVHSLHSIVTYLLLNVYSCSGLFPLNFIHLFLLYVC
jgi:hypothetical protein